MNPLCDPVEDIFAVGVQLDVTRFDQNCERLNGRPHFHPVVGRVGIATRYFFLVLAIADYGTPAAWPGIPFARAVGKYFNLLQYRFPTAPSVQKYWHHRCKNPVSAKMRAGPFW